MRSLSVLKKDFLGFSEVLIVYLITEKLGKNIRYWWGKIMKREKSGKIC